MSYTLVEPCSGSAAFTLHLLGATRSILPYQGSKWRFRRGLQERAEALGFRGCPARVVLTDPGPWGRTLGVILEPTSRAALIARLQALADEDARTVFERLQGATTATDDVGFASEFLFLQRLSFSGKAVGTREGCWVSPGFNTSSAYGLAATDRFGKVNPMVPSLIKVLESYHSRLAPVTADVQCIPAAAPTALDGPTLVYLDPPYIGSTAYPDGQMDRDAVVALAEAWAGLGAAVMISEQHGLPLLFWQRERLSRGRDDTSPFRGKQQEWLTFTPAR